MKKRIVGFLLFFTITTIYSQIDETSVIGFYNVENLFDTINDPNVNDEQFLPDGDYKWTSERYYDHVEKLAQVFDDYGDILAMGVAEIENRMVMEDILKYRQSNKLAIVHYDSEDARGVDVGLYYDSTRLKLDDSGFIRFRTVTSDITTRDIIWAKFFYKKQPLYFLVNHWPSRRGGAEASEPNRVLAAELALKFIDSVSVADKKAAFVFMGDLNDSPQDKAPKIISNRLSSMISKESGTYGGSYLFRGEWDVLDHIMVSKSLYTNKKFKVLENSGEIISFPYMIEQYKGNDVPFRVYVGRKYLGGYSDHFPVRIKVQLK